MNKTVKNSDTGCKPDLKSDEARACVDSLGSFTGSKNRQTDGPTDELTESFVCD